MKVILIAVSVFSICLGIVSCKPNVSPDSYSVGSVGQVNRVVRGVIVSARAVAISGTNTGIGAGAGAVAGGAGGSTIGGSTEANIAAGVAGAVVGGLVGAMAEQEMTRQMGMEYIIEVKNGLLITVVQGDESPLGVGDKVLVIYGGRARVIKSPN